mmetsp:Transcript_23702/g.38987  ORF Transcript_23702/g.38987 Transcript_23702/m.38987 type:complete len:659 (-) Transcript_23702:529-2505(-)
MGQPSFNSSVTKIHSYDSSRNSTFSNTAVLSLRALRGDRASLKDSTESECSPDKDAVLQADFQGNKVRFTEVDGLKVLLARDVLSVLRSSVQPPSPDSPISPCLADVEVFISTEQYLSDMGVFLAVLRSGKAYAKDFWKWYVSLCADDEEEEPKKDEIEVQIVSRQRSRAKSLADMQFGEAKEQKSDIISWLLLHEKERFMKRRAVTPSVSAAEVTSDGANQTANANDNQIASVMMRCRQSAVASLIELRQLYLESVDDGNWQRRRTKLGVDRYFRKDAGKPNIYRSVVRVQVAPHVMANYIYNSHTRQQWDPFCKTLACLMQIDKNCRIDHLSENEILVGHRPCDFVVSCACKRIQSRTSHGAASYQIAMRSVNHPGAPSRPEFIRQNIINNSFYIRPLDLTCTSCEVTYFMQIEFRGILPKVLTEVYHSGRISSMAALRDAVISDVISHPKGRPGIFKSDSHDINQTTHGAKSTLRVVVSALKFLHRTIETEPDHNNNNITNKNAATNNNNNNGKHLTISAPNEQQVLDRALPKLLESSSVPILETAPSLKRAKKPPLPITIEGPHTAGSMSVAPSPMRTKFPPLPTNLPGMTRNYSAPGILTTSHIAAAQTFVTQQYNNEDLEDYEHDDYRDVAALYLPTASPACSPVKGGGVWK